MNESRLRSLRDLLFKRGQQEAAGKTPTDAPKTRETDKEVRERRLLEYLIDLDQHLALSETIGLSQNNEARMLYLKRLGSHFARVVTKPLTKMETEDTKSLHNITKRSFRELSKPSQYDPMQHERLGVSGIRIDEVASTTVAVLLRTINDHGGQPYYLLEKMGGYIDSDQKSPDIDTFLRIATLKENIHAHPLIISARTSVQSEVR